MRTICLLKSNCFDGMCPDAISFMLAIEETSIKDKREYMNHVTDLCRLFRFSQSLTQDIVAIIDSVIHNTTVEDHKKMLQLFMQRQFHAYTPKHLQWNQDINELICHINRCHKPQGLFFGKGLFRQQRVD